MTTALEIPSLKGKVSDEEWAVRVDLAACYRLLVRYGWEDLTFTPVSYTHLTLPTNREV